jgi:hypothetical protein
MRTHLLGLAGACAALALCSAPAEAQAGGAFALSASSPGDGAGVRVHRGIRHPGFDAPSDVFQGCAAARGRHHGSGGASCEISVGTWVNGGEWALYNNRSWEADSFNDWWHDRPDRAFPRWMQANQDCARMWWGGGGWRC